MCSYLISVIVPVYNCEKYLTRGIDSLVNQTYFEKLEIIFVNDGSTDKSELIIDSYVSRYNNMRLFTQCNKGVSAARNTGIEKSNGSYIAFFDADDVAEPKLYETLYKLLINNEADISIVDYSMIFSDGTSKKHRDNCFKILSDKSDILQSFFCSNLICTNPVDKLFTRKAIENVHFPEGYAIGEDMFFVYKSLCTAKKIVIDSSQVLYKYCIHHGSAMKTSFSDKNFDSVQLAKMIMDEFDKKEKIYNYAEANYIHEICKMLGLLYNGKVENKYYCKASVYIQILKNYSIFKAIKYMDKKHFFALELMKLSPYAYHFVYRIMKVG